jgi:hypothetical protein
MLSRINGGEANTGMGALASQKHPQDINAKKRGRRPTTSCQGALRRYNLILPEELFQTVDNIAKKQHITTIDLLKKYIKLGLLASEIENDPDSKLIIRQGKTDREIIFI